MFLTSITVISAADNSTSDQVISSDTPSLDSSNDISSTNDNSQSTSNQDTSSSQDTVTSSSSHTTSDSTVSTSDSNTQQSSSTNSKDTTTKDSSTSSKDTTTKQDSSSDVKSSDEVIKQENSIKTTDTVDEKTQLKTAIATRNASSYGNLVSQINNIKSTGFSSNTYLIKLGDGTTDETYTITEPITWGDSQATDLIIDGQNHVTIDGQGSYRFMTVEEGYTLTLQNIIITNCYDSTIYGGVVNNEGTLNVINSELTNNHGNLFGGAIYNNGKLTVTESTFTDNSPILSLIYGFGGAIYNNGTATIEDSIFTKNTAYDGGSIYNNDNSAELTILGSTFTENQATVYSSGIFGEGGVIYNKGKISISYSTFTQNSAIGTTSYGGAIYNENGNISIEHSIFTENEANWSGAIYNKAIMTINSSTFTENTASTNGGAIYNLQGGDLTIENTSFINNNALNGGAIYSNSTSSKLTVQQSTFTENTASSGGGAIYLNCEAKILDSNFKDNTGRYGNSIYTDNLIEMSGNTFSMNNIIIKGSEPVTLYSPISDRSISSTSTDPTTNKIVFNIYDESGTPIDSVDGIFDSSTNNTSATYQFEESGIYTVKVVYRDFQNTMEFDVYYESMKLPVLTLEVDKYYVYVTDPVLITGTLKSEDEESLINAEVIISIDNEDHPVYTDDTGGYTYSYTPAITGIHTITATYRYTTVIEVTKTITITADQLGTIITLDPIEDVKLYDDITIGGELRDSEGNIVTGQTVYITINDYTEDFTTDEWGKFYVKYDVKSVGSYYVLVEHPKSGKYRESYNMASFTASKLDTTITVDSLTAKQYETVTLTAHVIDEKGNAVNEGYASFKLNDVTLLDDKGDIIYVSVIDGVGNLEYTVENSPKEYTITGLYYGVEDYSNAKSEYATLIVISSAVETTTTVDDVIAKQGETVDLTANVVDVYGHPVTEGQVVFKINNTTIKNSNGKDIYVDVTNGVATLEYTTPSTAKTYNITATYYGTDKYLNSVSNTATLTVIESVSALKTTTTVDNVVSREQETVNLRAHVVDENNNLVNEGQVTFKINNTTIKDSNNKDIYVDVVNGVATLRYTVINPVNYYNLTATYHGTDNYEDSTSQSAMLVVESSILKTQTTVENAIAKVNETITLTAHVIDENGNPVTEGPVSFSINNEMIRDSNGQIIFANVITGVATLEYNDTISADVYEIGAVFYGNDYYQTSTSKAAIFTSITSNLTTTITVNNITGKQHETIYLTAHIVDQNGNPVLEGVVAFKINDVTLKDDNGDVIYVDVVDGTATLPYTIDNSVKTYSIVGLYYGSNHYNTAKSEYEVLTVEESSLDTTITVDNVTGIYHRTVDLTAHIVDENGKRVTEGQVAFKINDVTLKDDNGDVIYVDVVNGTASLEYTVINSPKDYTITGLYYGSGGYHNSKSEYGTLTIEMSIMETTTTVDDITGQYDDIVYLTARVTDEYGYAVTSGRVIFKINGVTQKYANGTNIYVNVVNGIATFEYRITNNPKNYTIMAVYEGTSNYITSRSDDAVLTVEYKVVDLVVEKPTGSIKSGDTVTLKANILDEDTALADEGVVIFKLNGVTLKDENGNNLQATIVDGVATLNYTIPVDMAGKDYTLTAVYSNKNYEREEANNTLTLVRSDIETYLNPITITQGQNTRIYMELFDENNDHLKRSTKVAIKVNGKTQINTETSNGILNVTIPTSSLSPKAYDIEVVFGENSAYYEHRIYSTLTVIR